MDQSAVEITKHLNRLLESGSHQSQVFDDWLELTHASLETLPAHVSAAAKGAVYQETPETAALLERLRVRYDRPEWWKSFEAAFGVLLAAAEANARESDYRDILGQVYMDWGVPNKYTGQFFTPWEVARMMARITAGDIERQLHERIKAAAQKDPYLQAALFSSVLCQTPEQAEQWFYQKILPAAAPLVEPITVNDCACGSGVMLLAVASQCPRWALDYGLVQFYGADIDLTCVRMAQVNMMIYGLNGYGIKCALALSGAELAALPEPHAAAYAEAQQAQAAGNTDRVDQIVYELRAGVYRQGNLFEEATMADEVGWNS